MTPTPPGTQGREIHLLPRHWAWLQAQPRSASATLRRLVEEARRDPQGQLRLRETQAQCYDFLRDSAGDRPHFEAAIRALFAGDAPGFDAAVADWPAELRARSHELASAVWTAGADRSA